MTATPETVYNEFMSRRKLMQHIQHLVDPVEYKRGLASLYLEYQDRMGEELFEMFLDGERQANTYGY